MTEEPCEKVVVEMRALRVELAELRDLVEALINSQPRQSGDQLLSLKEAASMLRVKPDSLRRGLAGTRAVPRHSSRPITYLRSSVEQFIRDRARKAAESKDARKRISLLRRRK
jgi:DNA-binding transcriptional regulator YhcF (GntR family)